MNFPFNQKIKKEVDKIHAYRRSATKECKKGNAMDLLRKDIVHFLFIMREPLPFLHRFGGHCLFLVTYINIYISETNRNSN